MGSEMCIRDRCIATGFQPAALPTSGRVADGPQFCDRGAECSEPSPALTMAGRFLVLEGIDGCGKTTQLKLLSQWLPGSGLMPAGATLLLTREPGGTPLGKALRELLLHPPQDSAPSPTAELLMYAADRAQHVEHLIRPALDRGDWVLSDRFSGSTLAYQGDGRGLDASTIRDLERIATAGVTPDLTLWPVSYTHLRAHETS